MLGVVLWSDTNDNKAVIWCEDHGDLAYFNGNTDQSGGFVDFDAGDLVQFDVSQERHLRYARNPRRVGLGAYSGLPDTLSATSGGTNPQSRRNPPIDAMPTAQVIPFSQARGGTARILEHA